MEEGSLLQVALESAKAFRTNSDSESSSSSSSSSLLKNCIFLDLYSIGSHDGQQDHLLYLAELADYCSKFFQSKDYPWHYGGDGPVFGIHVDDSESKSVPHLRAYCRYGPSVQDEWMAIYYIMELTKSVRNDDDNNKGELVALVWDVQDGQVIFIQLADLLPTWLDEDPTENNRYSCWIQEGNLQILRQPHITLEDALHDLKRRRTESTTTTTTTTTTTSSHPRIQHALMYWLDLNVQAASVRQRTPMVLPRKVARLFQDHPEFLPIAIQVFCDHAQQDTPVESNTIQPDLTNKYEDWIWTIQTLSKTNYAMARTVTSIREGNWTSSSDSIPITVGVELKRYQRQCKMESTKHLKHAVALGVRAVTGLELLLGTTNNYHGMFSSSTQLSSLQERIAYWARVEQNCTRSYDSDNNHNNGNIKSTMLVNFQKGPNNAEFDLSNVLKCPVFPEEGKNWTLFSNPEVALRDQIKTGMASTHSGKNDDDDDDDDESFSVPRTDQIDTDEWMDYKGERGDNAGTISSENDVDNLLSRFQSFLKQSSDVDGVASNNNVVQNTVDIRPRIFLNILHSVLKGNELEFPHVDPFFHQEDYDLVEEDDDDDDDDDDNDNDNDNDEYDTGNKKESFGMKDLMDAMDNELEGRTESRRIPGTHNAHNEEGKVVNGSVDEDAHILNNLIQSLDASGGESGPVVNILKEMEKTG